ncbi:acyl-CoA dehydrogenase family protein [Shouchella shacheensis]|uniref:acyl-CoA dehydrogenase family protein n=1 Tax=Shouchella shacheensis TaxID=1649580 RepID=UPI000AF685F5|nr:acyl-CoA dehydrogenase family protein [Shouchella shacheensis]
MKVIMMNFLELDTFAARKQAVQELAASFYESGRIHDQEQTLPVENIEALKQAKYTALAIPREYGGREISLTELVTHQQTLAEAHGATALAIGWHMGTTYQLAHERIWPEEIFERVSREMVRGAGVLNAAATEKGTGSPTRGGKFSTTVTDGGDHFIVNGTKTFTTMVEKLDYVIVTSVLEETNDVVNVLVPCDAKGIEIEPTWNMMAMGATGSHDLHLRNVKIPKTALVETKTSKESKPLAWLLHIPACYLGIAKAAINEAARFAKSYSPSSIKGTIADLPNVKQKLGEATILYEQNRHFLYSVATKWDQGEEQERKTMGTELAIVKYTTVNAANEIVDLAMRVAGAHSLSNDSPLSHYYKDVRAGLHNPPMDDRTVILAAEQTLNE